MIYPRAYPFQYDRGGLNGYEWRVWRPDQRHHHVRGFENQAQAQLAADKINKSLTCLNPECIACAQCNVIFQCEKQS